MFERRDGYLARGARRRRGLPRQSPPEPKENPPEFWPAFVPRTSAVALFVGLIVTIGTSFVSSYLLVCSVVCVTVKHSQWGLDYPLSGNLYVDLGMLVIAGAMLFLVRTRSRELLTSFFGVLEKEKPRYFPYHRRNTTQFGECWYRMWLVLKYTVLLSLRAVYFHVAVPVFIVIVLVAAGIVYLIGLIISMIVCSIFIGVLNWLPGCGIAYPAQGSMVVDSIVMVVGLLMCPVALKLLSLLGEGFSLLGRVVEENPLLAGFATVGLIFICPHFLVGFVVGWLICPLDESGGD